MDKREYLLACLIKECAGMQQAASEALLFGTDYKNKDSTAAQNIERGFSDVLSIIEMLSEEEIIEKENLSEEILNQKKNKIMRLMTIAKECGTLTQNPLSYPER